MKQKLLTRLVMASLCGAAMVGAQAGQIQASSVSIAREVITTDTQAVTSPSISYRFAGDVDARAQPQTFQVQFILDASSGLWANLPAGIANAIQISDGVTGAIINQQAGAGGIRYVVTATGLSTDKKNLWATLTVAQDPTALIKQPIISLNVANNTINGAAATAVVVADRASVTGLKTVVGDLVADYAAGQVCTAVKSSKVEFKHFVALSNPSAIADTLNGTADEHTRAGNTSNATLITYPTNITAKFTSSTGTLRLQSGGNLTFDSTGAVPLAPSAAPSTPGTAHVVAPGAGQLTARLGIAQLVQNANGLDSNVTNAYRLDNGGNGITNGQATAVLINGEVEAQRLDIKVSASAGFVVGGTLFTAVAGNNCLANSGGPGSTVAITAANAAGPITLAVTAAATLGAVTGADPIEVCYTVPGTTLIPSSVFTGEARLVKSAAGAGLNEQDNQCNGPLYSLGGGLKIDVRNYASSKETSGYTSVLRFINNSDTRTADVWAQHINQDGKLGNWAKLTDLAPRASLNMTAAQIDAKLAAGSTATAAIGTAAPTAQAAVANVSSDTAPRLRVVSSGGASLRVQNYLFNAATGQILEGSNSQGVDYEIPGAVTTQRTGSNDQGISQDANSGLNLK